MNRFQFYARVHYLVKQHKKEFGKNISDLVGTNTSYYQNKYTLSTPPYQVYPNNFNVRNI